MAKKPHLPKRRASKKTHTVKWTHVELWGVSWSEKSYSVKLSADAAQGLYDALRLSSNVVRVSMTSSAG